MVLQNMLLAADVIDDAAKQVEKSADVVTQTMNRLVNWCIGKSGSILIALLVIVAGIKIVSWILKLMKRSLERSKVETSVAGFLISIVRVVGYVLVFLSAASIVGFQVTSFVTILGTASLSVGFALQGALSNLAGGVLILVLKPFQVGDYIIENNKGNEGTVVSIDIVYTRLRTHDNKIVVIPNGVLADNSLVNVTEETKRKVDIKIPIAYDSDIAIVKELVESILKSDARVLADEPINIFIDSFEESSMKLGVRCWVETAEYWDVTWDLREKIKTQFDQNGVRIPYNRLEVDLLNERKEKKHKKKRDE